MSNTLIKLRSQNSDWELKWCSQNFTYSIFIANEVHKLKRNFLYANLDPYDFKPPINILPKVKVTSDISQADFVLVPHPWVYIKHNYEYKKYLKYLSNFCPLLVANSDDISPKCDLPNTVQLRSFLHPKENDFRKIIFPYPVKSQVFSLRSWKTSPTISFLGFIPKLTIGSLTSKSMSFPLSPIRSSVYLNRRIAALKLQNLQKNFKVIFQPKSKFTLLPENMNLNFDIQQYKENMLESDYILCPRGFGNTSMRFFETLSSGATPLLIESGTKLPNLDDNEFWKKNIISLSLFSNWTKAIKEDWKLMSIGDNYTKRQLQNREVFKSQLDFQVFAEKFFSGYLGQN